MMEELSSDMCKDGRLKERADTETFESPVYI